jgi:hypothetical protein
MVKLFMATCCMPLSFLSARRLGSSLFMSLLLLLLSVPGMAQSPQPQAQANLLSAFVDSTNIAINDVITLTVRIDSSLAAGSRPQFSGLNREFEQVGGISSRNTYTNNNGDIQSWTEYSIRLRPLTTGTLTIPAFRINGQVSNSIQVSVSEARQNANREDSDIFLRTEVSKNSVYVQEQLLYTIKIFWSVSFDQGAQLTSPQVSDAVVQQLGNDANYQEVVNGIGYNVTERKFVVFPQKSGELVIPPVYFTASVGRRGGFNALLRSRGAVREINLASETHNIEVKAQPASFPAGATWLPARQITLEETWNGDFDNLEVGDALTRNITLRADGLSSSLLPGITNANQDGLRFYPDQPLREDGADAMGVYGKRSEGTAIVPSKSGEFTLPEVSVPWWNTATDQLETATLPARTFNVRAAAGSANPADILSDADTAPPEQVADTAVVEARTPMFWIVATIVFAAAWALTTAAWLRGRQQAALVATGGAAALRMPDRKSAKGDANATNPNADAALRQLKTACDASQLREIRGILLAWGQAASGDSDIRTLEALAHRCHDDELSTLLQALDAALYGTGKVDCRALYNRVAALHKQGLDGAKDADKYRLPPLYKQ